MEDLHVGHRGQPAQRERLERGRALGLARDHEARCLGCSGFHDAARVQDADGLQRQQHEDEEARQQHRRLDGRLRAALAKNVNTG